MLATRFWGKTVPLLQVTLSRNSPFRGSENQAQAISGEKVSWKDLEGGRLAERLAVFLEGKEKGILSVEKRQMGNQFFGKLPF